MPTPVITACPSAVELDPAPFPHEWVLDGEPRARAKEIARSRDGAMTVVAWSCTKGRFRWQYLVDEMVHILAGEVVIVDHTDTERRLVPGDTAFFPAGSSSVWDVKHDMRKVAVCRVEMPKPVALGLRIWNKLRRLAGAGAQASSLSVG
jgi:uncharacterized protein